MQDFFKLGRTDQAGTSEDTVVYQQLHHNGRRLLRIVVALQPDSQGRTVLVTLYDTTKVAKYWQVSTPQNIYDQAESTTVL